MKRTQLNSLQSNYKTNKTEGNNIKIYPILGKRTEINLQSQILNKYLLND